MNTARFEELNSIFFPRNTAIIGASPSDNYTYSLLATKMRDRLYFVNPNYQEVLGRKSYANIMDIDVPIDYAVIAVPVRFALSAVSDCIKKGVKGVHLFTSGFSETGLPEGIKREKELADMARGKIRIIGPNCMGSYCPKSGLSFNPASTNVEGNIGVISQSGTFAQLFIYAGKSMNMKISKMVSYGNAVDLDCPDFLEYLADDPDTSVIALYIEGIRDGKRLRSALEYAAGKKPLVALKGGVTEAGGRVASSHTGSLAGTAQIWSTMFSQSGAVQVDDIDDLLNTTITMDLSRVPSGNGVAIVTYSGGFAVVQSDMCVKAGLQVPQFSRKAIDELRRFVPAAGTMIGNPLDSWQLFYRFAGEGRLSDVLRIVAGEKQIHSIILQFDIIRFMTLMWGDGTEEKLRAIAEDFLAGCRFARDEAGRLVIITVAIDAYTDNEAERRMTLLAKKMCEEAGFPVAASLREAIRAVSYMYKYAAIKK
ncbi:MAG: CoA-binding protein [Dehalococcoidia bacterium]